MSNKEVAIAIPLGVETTKKGTSAIFAAAGTSREAVDTLAKLMGNEFGTEVSLIDQPDSKTTFGFSGHWNAPWNPEGPRPNWRVNSLQDPSLN